MPQALRMSGDRNERRRFIGHPVAGGARLCGDGPRDALPVARYRGINLSLTMMAVRSRGYPRGGDGAAEAVLPSGGPPARLSLRNVCQTGAGLASTGWLIRMAMQGDAEETYCLLGDLTLLVGRDDEDRDS
jgi:hypothetical protein